MKQNPYKGIVKAKTMIPGHTSLPGQNNAIFNSAGDLNANSTKDALAQLGNLIAAAQNGNIVKSSVEDKVTVNKNRSDVLAEAMADKSGKTIQLVGEALAAEVYETTNREGFARRLLQYREIGHGESNEIVLKEKSVVAFVAISPSEVVVNEIRQKRLQPPEFHVNGSIVIDTGELARSKGDLMEEKYEEGLEAIMVQEDRTWKILADEASTVRNTLQTFSTFTPSVMARLINQVDRWGIPVSACLFASDLWQDVIANGDFAGVFDPVTKWELLQEGYLGQLYNVPILTDAFRQKSLRVLDDGEIYIVGAPINHGVFTLRGTLLAEPTNQYNQNIPKKGWFFDEIISMTINNSLSVSKGTKI